jgi:Zn-dependent oligopeptidase
VKSLLGEPELSSHGFAHYIAQSLLDLRLHTYQPPKDLRKTAREIFKRVYYPLPDGAAHLASFAHLIDYDSLYWVYLWAEMISHKIYPQLREKSWADHMRTFYAKASFETPKNLIENLHGKKIRSCKALMEYLGD